ncbi:MAG: hypothetical protein AAF809_00540 [Bacteroidota bacterium]
MPIIRAFDALSHGAERPATRRAIGAGLVVAFLSYLVVIELRRQGLLPPGLAERVPTSHFYAVDLAFKLLLLVEVVELVFGLARSVAEALGKQLEILSLILLRDAFKELPNFPEPIEWLPERVDAVLHMLADVSGALVIFVILGFYYRAQQHRRITASESEQARFVTTKKRIAFGLLVLFVGIGVYDLVRWGMGLPVADFFATFYTVLIFADVLIVLTSLRYASFYAVVFRNSAFAMTTVLIRLALAAPPYVNAALGIGAALLALGLTLAYNRFALDIAAEEPEEALDPV